MNQHLLLRQHQHLHQFLNHPRINTSLASSDLHAL
jgi:hypothetical protein